MDGVTCFKVEFKIEPGLSENISKTVNNNHDNQEPKSECHVPHTGSHHDNQDPRETSRKENTLVVASGTSTDDGVACHQVTSQSEVSGVLCIKYEDNRMRVKDEVDREDRLRVKDEVDREDRMRVKDKVDWEVVPKATGTSTGDGVACHQASSWSEVSGVLCIKYEDNRMRVKDEVGREAIPKVKVIKEEAGVEKCSLFVVKYEMEQKSEQVPVPSVAMEMSVSSEVEQVSTPPSGAPDLQEFSRYDVPPIVSTEKADQGKLGKKQGVKTRNTEGPKPRTPKLGNTGNPKPFKCSDCTQKFTSRELLEQHKQCKHSNHTPYKCPICGEGFRSMMYCKKHKRDRHEAKYPICCSVCGKGFNELAKLESHRKKRHPRTDYKCKQCDKLLTSLNSYRQHLAKMHPDNACHLCEKKFSERRRLNSHIAWAHEGKPRPKTYKGISSVCEVCGKVLSTRLSLKNHMLTHSGERKYTCDVCGKTFKTDAGIRLHKKSHKEAQLKCDICDKTFKLKHQLQNHMHTHSDVRKFSCDVCQLKFKMAHHLRSHVKTKHSDC